MNVYFDTEFTGLVKNTQLISLGCIADNGNAFYAEFTDFDQSNINEWLKLEVIPNLLFKKVGEYHEIVKSSDSKKKKEILPHGYEDIKDIHLVKGDSDTIKRDLISYFNTLISNDDEKILLVSDVAHYDMTLFCNLFGGALNLPKYIIPSCYDISVDIGTYVTEGENFTMADITLAGFNYSREKLYAELYNIDMNTKKTIESFKHNALFDAYIIKKIFNGIYDE